MNHTCLDEVIHPIDPMNLIPIRVKLDHRGGGVLQADPVGFTADGVIAQISGKSWGNEVQQEHRSDGSMGHQGNAIVVIVCLPHPFGDTTGTICRLCGSFDAGLAPPLLGNRLREDGAIGDGRQGRQR